MCQGVFPDGGAPKIALHPQMAERQQEELNMEIINDFSFLAPYMIKSVILFLVIGLSSIVVNKISFSVPEDDE